MSTGKIRFGHAACGIWCAVTSFLSPVWLVLIYLLTSGDIYQYDGTMDEGTAGILGFGLLVLWIIIVLLPDIWWLKKMRSLNRKYLLPALTLLLLFALVNMAICHWDIVAYLTTPGGI